MPGKRQIVANLLSNSGALRVLRGLVPGKNTKLLVLAYHRVYDMQDESSFPYDPELISARSEDFLWQMQFVKKYFSPVTFSNVLAAIDGGPPLPKHSLIISFDDGHLDNYTHAYPVLRSLGIPATIFLSTGYIGSSRTFWFDRLSVLIYNAPQGDLDIPELSLRLSLGQDVASRRAATELLLSRLKRLPDATRLGLLDLLESRLAQYVPQYPHDLSAALSWEQVQEMSKNGIEFGSHTVNHPILAMLEEQQLHYELSESKRSIEHRTGQPAPILAYPVGGHHAFDQRVIDIAGQCGYRMGVSYLSGTNNVQQLDLFSIRRLHVERYTTREDFEALLTLPQIFG